MKRLVIAVALGLLGCAAALAQCIGNPLNVALVANGSTNEGSVSVTNDSTNVYITVTTTGTATMSQLAAALGATLADIPQTANQTPIVSQFPYTETFSPPATTYTFTIPQGSLSAGSTVYIAVQATLAAPAGSNDHDGRDGYGDGGNGGNGWGGDDHGGGSGGGNDGGQVVAWGAGQLFAGSPACSQGNGDGRNGDNRSSLSGKQAVHLDGGYGNGWGGNGNGGNGGNGGGNGGNCGGGGGNNNNSQCGAQYFTYTINCAVVQE